MSLKEQLKERRADFRVKRKAAIEKAKDNASRIDSGEAIEILGAAKELGLDLLMASADGKLSLSEGLEIAGDMRRLAALIDAACKD